MKKWCLFLVVILLVTSCGKSDTATPEVQTAEPDKAETIVERIERLKIEDVVAVIDMRIEMLSQNLDVKVTSNTNLSYTADPQRLHVEIDSIVNDNANNTSRLEAYADGQNMLLMTNYDANWHKYTYANQVIDPNSMIQMYTTANFGQFYETWKDYIVVTETDQDYTITLDGSGEGLKDLVLDEMRTIQGLRVDDALFDLYLVKQVNIVYKFDKATNHPISMDLFMNYMFRAEAANTEHKLTLNTKYLHVNNGLTLELPSEFETLEVESNAQ